MKAMDGDCATGPWRERPGLVTLTHARDPIEWQTTLYYYAGAGSKLVAPDRGATLVAASAEINQCVAADQDERLWAAWMAEGHRSRRPAGCRPGAAPGYSPGKRLHNGFGKYRPNFFTRSLVSSCGCGGARDPHGVPLGYSCRADIYDRPLGPDDLARAKRVLAAFDVVIPVGAAVMERRKPEIDAYLHAKLGASTGKTVSLPWAHRNSSAHADLSVPACVRAALEEQNAFDVLLWHWIQERLEASLDAFSRGRAALPAPSSRAKGEPDEDVDDGEAYEDDGAAYEEDYADITAPPG